MNLIKTKIEGVVVIEPELFMDERGYFFESFNLNEFEENIGRVKFVQDNESMSPKGVIRGLHFQNPPHDQAKLVRCVKGSVLDVVVDIRKGSATYGKHISVQLSEQNKKQLFIPRGFAHGFSVLSENAIFSYKVDNYYAADFDSGISPIDPDLKIDWIIDKKDVCLSDKDKKLTIFKNFESPFKL